MPIAKITGQGLAAIAISVALLWGSFIGEHVRRCDAVQERERVMRDVQNLQRQLRSVPVSDPSPLVPSRLHVTAG